MSVIYHKTQQGDICYYQGNRLFQKGSYEEAIPLLSKSISYAPSNKRALADLAYSYKWSGDFTNAIKTFETLLAINHDDYKIKRSLARVYSWTKDYDKAITLYADVVKNAYTIEAEKELGDVYLWNNQPDMAIAIYTGLVSKEKGIEDKLGDLIAQAYLAKADLNRSEQAYRDLLEYQPENTEAAAKLANILSWKKNYKEAIALYKKVVATTNDPAAKKRLAEIYIWDSKPQEAEAILIEITGKDPRDFDAMLMLAKAYHYTGKHKEAETLYNELITNPAMPDSQREKLKKEFENIMAEISLTESDFEKARIRYKLILDKDPRNIEALVKMAELLSWQKEYDESIKYYHKALALNAGDMEVKLKLAQVYTWKGEYRKAEPILLDILKHSPDNIEAATLIADIYAYSGDFDRAIYCYNEILKQKSGFLIKEKLADTLSWDMKYNEAITLYDELLNERQDPEVMIKKARVLGWEKRYKDALKQYQAILDLKFEPKVALEMNAKQAYWNNRVKKAIKLYSELISWTKDNLEAMFDLSQVYSYQSMWKDAIGTYRHILSIAPTHFRAKEGLEKSELITKRISINSGYEYFESESVSRDSDIKRSRFSNILHIPINYHSDMDIQYNLALRRFKDFNNVTENQVRIMLAYERRPDWWISGFYDYIEYNRSINGISEGGGTLGFRLFDASELKLSYERNRLENNSRVIRDGYYQDDALARIDIDANSNLKIGADFLFSEYSDNNRKYEPAADIKYFLSLEPKMFFLKYRFYFRDFHKTVTEYFSPRDFSTHAIEAYWRHYLNKEEIFFGADDLYYELGYKMTIDSDGIVGNMFTGGFCWDVNKRLQMKAEGQYVHSSASVYEDKRAFVTGKYYF